MRQRAILAPADEINGVLRLSACENARPNARPLFGALKKQRRRLSKQAFWLVAKFAHHRRIGELYHPFAVDREDVIERIIDERRKARILPLAQDGLALR